MALVSYLRGRAHTASTPASYGDASPPLKPCTAGFDVREQVESSVRTWLPRHDGRAIARNRLNLCIAHGGVSYARHVMVDAEALG